MVSAEPWPVAGRLHYAAGLEFAQHLAHGRAADADPCPQSVLGGRADVDVAVVEQLQRAVESFLEN